MIGIVTFVVIVLFVAVALLSLCCIEYSKALKRVNIDYDNATNVLYGIAYDYHIRVIKSGWGDLFEDNNVQNSNCDSGCISILNSNEPIDISNIINGNSCEKYYIYFRIFGKHYLAYSPTEMTSWLKVVSKAREENKNLFGKSSYIDKHKI